MKNLPILLLVLSFSVFASNDHEFSLYHGIEISPTEANNIREHRRQQIRREIQNERAERFNAEQGRIRPKMDPGGSYLERRRWADFLEGR